MLRRTASLPVLDGWLRAALPGGPGAAQRLHVVQAAWRIAATQPRERRTRPTLAAALWLALKLVGVQDWVPPAWYLARYTGVARGELLAAEVAVCAAAGWRLWAAVEPSNVMDLTGEVCDACAPCDSCAPCMIDLT